LKGLPLCPTPDQGLKPGLGFYRNGLFGVAQNANSIPAEHKSEQNICGDSGQFDVGARELLNRPCPRSSDRVHEKNQ
jgi:hypothetical protein